MEALIIVIIVVARAMVNLLVLGVLLATLFATGEMVVRKVEQYNREAKQVAIKAEQTLQANRVLARQKAKRAEQRAEVARRLKEARRLKGDVTWYDY